MPKSPARTNRNPNSSGPQKPAFLRIRFDSYRRCRHIGPQNANPINQPNDTRFHFICTKFFVNCISVLPLLGLVDAGYR